MIVARICCSIKKKNLDNFSNYRSISLSNASIIFSKTLTNRLGKYLTRLYLHYSIVTFMTIFLLCMKSLMSFRENIKSKV